MSAHFPQWPSLAEQVNVISNNAPGNGTANLKMDVHTKT